MRRTLIFLGLASMMAFAAPTIGRWRTTPQIRRAPAIPGRLD